MKNSKKMDFPAEKLAHPDLRKLAEEKSGEVASVLIELDLPAPQVEVGKNPYRGAFDYALKRVTPETASQQKQSRQQINTATTFLKRVLGETPRWLNSARVFVAEVNPEQLRTIANSPLTKAIRPNRKIEVYRGKK